MGTKLWASIKWAMITPKNEPSIRFLFHLFTTCFERGIVSDAWRKVLITPLAENRSGDLGDPGNYRGISLQSVILKMLCTILKNRLVSLASLFYRLSKGL